MQITPFIGDARVRSDSFSIVVDPQDEKRVEALVSRAQQVTAIDDQSFEMVRTVAGQIKAMLNEIEDSKKAAKRPFMAVETAIENRAQLVARELVSENKRVLGLLNSYVAHKEAEAQEAARRKAEEQAREQARLQAELDRANEERRKAEEAARLAQDEAERLRQLENARRIKEAAFQAEMDAALSLDEEPVKAPTLVPGGRVDHPWEFKLMSVEAVVRAGHWRLLKWEINYSNCRDAVKALLELNPDQEPVLPGIKITRNVSVSVKASA